MIIIGRMSAKFLGREVGLGTKDVYDIWDKMGKTVKVEF